MKKILTLTTAVLLFAVATHAAGDKGKDKGKKPKTVKTCSGKTCGKECGKKKC